MKRRNQLIIVMLLLVLFALIKSDYLTVLQTKIEERDGITDDQLGTRLED